MMLTLKHNDEDEGLGMMLTSSTMMRMRSGHDAHLKHNDEDEGLDMMLTSSTMMRMRVWTGVMFGKILCTGPRRQMSPQFTKTPAPVHTQSVQ
jgi:hypothetical protein